MKHSGIPYVLTLLVLLLLAGGMPGATPQSVSAHPTRYDSCPNPPCPPVVPPPPPTGGQAPQTDQRFLQFWQQNGGLFIFGYPLTTALEEQLPDGRTRFVQWFERARLEIYSDNPNAIHVATLGLELRGFVNDPVPYQDGCLYFDDTQQPLCEPFLSFWLNHGIEIDGVPGYSFVESIALLGQPIATPRYELHGRNSAGIFLTQWFERGRLEYHPENAGTPYQVLPGRVGMELYSQLQGPFGDPSVPTDDVPSLDTPADDLTAPPDPTFASVPTPDGACATNAPAPAEEVQAWMTNGSPAMGEEVTLCVRLILDGQPVSGAEATGLIQYETGEVQVGPVNTAADGVATMPFSVDEAASGVIEVPVLVRYEERNQTGQTSFTVP